MSRDPAGVLQASSTFPRASGVGPLYAMPLHARWTGRVSSGSAGSYHARLFESMTRGAFDAGSKQSSATRPAGFGAVGCSGTRAVRAMVLTGHGGLDRYEWREDWPEPVPGPTEALIRVGACGLNNTDVNIRTGWYARTPPGATGDAPRTATGGTGAGWSGRPVSFPRIQGADVVGEVVAVGGVADAGLVGARVMVDAWLRDPSDPGNPAKAGYLGSEADGGFAEYVRCGVRNLAVVESDLTDSELATFPCSHTTAEGMLDRARVGAKDTVLIPGASGGVGCALVQLARRRGARTIAMASESKHALVATLGPDKILPRSPPDLRAAVRGETVTVVADVVGGPGWPALVGILARGGRYTCSGAVAGPHVELDLRDLYLRDLTFTGSTVVSERVFRDVVGHIERGEVRPVLAAEYPLSELRAAQRAFIQRRHVGNIVVVP